MDAYEEALARVRALRPGEIHAVPREALTPRPATWRRSIGMRAPGASALTQWRDGVIHIHVTPTHYLLHRDTVDPHRELLRHLREDSPQVLELASRVARILVGALLLAGIAAGVRLARRERVGPLARVLQSALPSARAFSAKGAYRRA